MAIQIDTFLKSNLFADILCLLKFYVFAGTMQFSR